MIMRNKKNKKNKTKMTSEIKYKLFFSTKYNKPNDKKELKKRRVNNCNQ